MAYLIINIIINDQNMKQLGISFNALSQYQDWERILSNSN